MFKTGKPAHFRLYLGRYGAESQISMKTKFVASFKCHIFFAIVYALLLVSPIRVLGDPPTAQGLHVTILPCRNSGPVKDVTVISGDPRDGSHRTTSRYKITETNGLFRMRIPTTPGIIDLYVSSSKYCAGGDSFSVLPGVYRDVVMSLGAFRHSDGHTFVAGTLPNSGLSVRLVIAPTGSQTGDSVNENEYAEPEIDGRFVYADSLLAGRVYVEVSDSHGNFLLRRYLGTTINGKIQFFTFDIKDSDLRSAFP